MAVSASAVQTNLQDYSGTYYYKTGNATAYNFYEIGGFPLTWDTSYSKLSSIDAYSRFDIQEGFPSFSSASTNRLYCRFIFPSEPNIRELWIYFYGNSSSTANSRLKVDVPSSTFNFYSTSSPAPISITDYNFSFLYDRSGSIIGLQFDSAYLNLIYRIQVSYYTGTYSSLSFTNSFSSYDDLIISTEPISDVPTYTPTITATTSNVTDTTVDLAINVTGMDPAKTYNIRIDGTTADGEELSQVIGTITGEETYSGSATLGPFTPNTTYRATLVLVENGVDISSDLIEYTTLPPTYAPQISASQFAVTSTTLTSQVTLSGLDPSKQYRPYYRLSLADDDTVISQGYALDIMPVTGIGEYTAYSRINNLTANTEYRIIWALFEDGTEYVDAFDYFNFTTLDDGSGGGGSGSFDDNSGILLMILNKVSAILDAMNGGQSEGILASINEKLDALIDTLANPEEQQLEDNFKGSLTEVNNNFFGDTAKGQAVTVSDVGNLADTQSTVKTIFQSDYTVTDFFGLFSDNSFFGWFSAETAMDLNPISYGGVSVADMDDPYNMQAYYDNLEKVRGKK